MNCWFDPTTDMPRFSTEPLLPCDVLFDLASEDKVGLDKLLLARLADVRERVEICSLS